jgi:hypothetical protein
MVISHDSLCSTLSVPVVAPEAEPRLWVVVTGQSTTPPRVLYVSRIEIRLLRDTRRVLEYLSEGECGQPSVYDTGEKMKR